MTVKEFPNRAPVEAESQPNPAIVSLLTELLQMAKKGELYSMMVISEYNGPNYRTDYAGLSPLEIPRYLSYMELNKFDLIMAHKAAVKGMT